MDVETTFMKKISCPHCKKEISVLRVKSRFFKNMQRFPDFGVIYEDNFSPYLYEIVVCPNCGYAWNVDGDEALMPAHVERLKPILANWKYEDYNCELRTQEQAIAACMRGILCDQVRQAKASGLAKKALHLAWIYRGLKDSVNEKRFLTMARDNYRIAMNTEDLWGEHKGNEILVTYLTAVLSFYIGDDETGKRWLSRVIFNHPEAEERPNIVKMAKELWFDIRHSDWKSSLSEIEELAKSADKG